VRWRDREWQATAVVVVGTAVVFAWQTVRRIVGTRRGDDPWQTGDWLIDYAAGPVRRDLIGTLLGLLPGAEPARWALVGIQTACYAVIFAVAVALFLRSRRRSGWVPVVLSPAFLLFGMFDFPGSNRKEILGLTALAGLLWLASCAARPNAARPNAEGAALAAACAVYGLAVFSHELNVLLLPALLVAVGMLRRHRSDAATAVRRTRIVLCALAVAGAAMAVAGAAMAVAAPGDAEAAETICADVTARGFDPEVCTGAIRALGADLGEARDGTYLRRFSATYVPLLALGALPLIAVPWVRRHWRLVVGQTVAILALSALAHDHGRWIALAATTISLLALAGTSDGTSDGEGPPRSLPVLASVAFVVAWRLPHACISECDPTIWMRLGTLV
jgi:hypothetical protein